MKNIFVILKFAILSMLLVVVAALCSCAAEAILYDEFRKETQQEEPADETPRITMTTDAHQITLFLSGNGTAEIDWGDRKETVTLAVNLAGPAIVRTYSSATERTITISGNNITGLSCNANQITVLDISKYPALTELRCAENSIEVLDLENNTALGVLDCTANQLTVLNVEKNIELKWLFCADNQLTILNVVENNKALSWLDCQNNQLNAAQLNNLFTVLHNNMLDEEKLLLITGNIGAEAANKSIAENKGWRVE